MQFYISEQKRQRSEKEVNSTFRTNQDAAASGGRKSKNHGFLAAFFPPFLSLLKEMGPPEAMERGDYQIAHFPPQAASVGAACWAAKDFRRMQRQILPHERQPG